MGFQKRAAAVAVMLATVGGSVVLTSTAAQAVTPSCTQKNLIGTQVGGQVWAPTTSSKVWKCALVRGNHNAAVGALQEGLNDCYGASLSLDNDFGTNTYNALKAAQRTAGVAVDGEYGPNTASALKFPSSLGITCRTTPIAF